MMFKTKMTVDQRGFLFAEVMILLLTLGLLLPALTAMFRVADKAVVMAERQTKALQLAQREQEALKRTAVLAALGESDERKVSLENLDYTIMRQKKRVFLTGSVNGEKIWQISVKVSWGEYLEETKVCQLKIVALHKQD